MLCIKMLLDAYKDAHTNIRRRIHAHTYTHIHTHILPHLYYRTTKSINTDMTSKQHDAF